MSKLEMSEEHNPEAWAAWTAFCTEHFPAEDLDDPSCPLLSHQAAFEAGWVGAVTEVVRQQGEMYPQEQDS